MLYEYKSPDGTRVRTISASMRNPPPERVLFRESDEVDEEHYIPQWEAAPDDPDVPAWTRVYGNVTIDAQRWSSKAYGVGRIDLPKGLPGCEVDRNGRSIVRNKAHERDICRQYGYVRYED